MHCRIVFNREGRMLTQMLVIGNFTSLLVLNKKIQDLFGMGFESSYGSCGLL